MNRWAVLILAALIFLNASTVGAGESWVTTVAPSGKWAAFLCRDRIVTNVCWTDKKYSGPGALPATISVGDTIRYTNRKGERATFTVKSISFFIYDKNVDTTWAGKRRTVKEGDTTCSLYDTASRRDIEKGYPSKIVVQGCQVVR